MPIHQYYLIGRSSKPYGSEGGNILLNHTIDVLPFTKGVSVLLDSNCGAVNNKKNTLDFSVGRKLQ